MATKAKKKVTQAVGTAEEMVDILEENVEAVEKAVKPQIKMVKPRTPKGVLLSSLKLGSKFELNGKIYRLDDMLKNTGDRGPMFGATCLVLPPNSGTWVAHHSEPFSANTRVKPLDKLPVGGN